MALNICSIPDDCRVLLRFSRQSDQATQPSIQYVVMLTRNVWM
jgi:hypothetical protein